MKTTGMARLALASTFLVLAACGDVESDVEDTTPTVDTAASMEADAAERTARAELSPTDGNDVRGTVTFTEAAGGVRVSANITGLTDGLHGFHIHETGDCSAPDGSSAGGHFAPEQSQHGGPDQQPPQAHVGDMGNLEAGEDGTASYEGTFSTMAFEGTRGIIGKAVIVHAGEDDLTTQPTGDAGGRQACGVIEAGAAAGTGAGTGTGVN